MASGFMLKRKVIVILAIVCGIVSSASAQLIRTEPFRRGEFVRDLAGMLDSEGKQRIQELGRTALADGFAPVLVMTIKSVKAYAGRDLPFHAFSILFFSRLQDDAQSVAGPDRAKSILLLISRDDRKVAIELGARWGHEDYVAARLIKEEKILPRLRQDEFSLGIVAGAQALDEMARGTKPPGTRSTWWHAPMALARGSLKGLGVGLAFLLVAIGIRAAEGARARFFGAKALYAAVRDGEEELVGEYLKGGVDPDSRDNKGATPIFYASRDGHSGIVGLLLEHDAHPNAKTFRGDFPLYQAAQEGYDDVVELLLSHGAHTAASNKAGVTPLIIAAHKGHLNVVESLLRHDASTKAQNKLGLSALFAAVEKGHEELVSLLLNSGADINQPTHEGITPLMRSVMTVKQKRDPEIMRLLISHGSDINACARSPQNTTALMMAVQMSEMDSVKMLLDSGADIDLKYEGELDSIGLAERKDDPMMVDLLSKHKEKGGARLNILDAVRRGNLKRVKEILEGNASQVDVRTANSRWSSLHLAAMDGDLAMLELLLGRGADTQAKNKKDETPEQVASDHGHEQLAARIQEFEANKINILDAVRTGDRTVVQQLLYLDPRGVRVLSTHKNWTALHLAAMDGNEEIVELLIAHGANINAANKDGKTPCAVAVEGGHDVVAVLLQNYQAEAALDRSFLGAVGEGDLEKVKGALRGKPSRARMASASRRWTPLHFAVADGREDMVELLLDNGADGNAANKDGKTALHQAASRGDIHILELLLAHGADIKLKYHDQTPLDRAREMGHEKAAELLRSAETGSAASD